MARDLYGEMLSRALNRGAPQGHFAAYIQPNEAALLRSQGGGVAPGGGQYVSNGLPSYPGMSMYGGGSTSGPSGALGGIDARDRARANAIAAQADAQAINNATAIDRDAAVAKARQTAAYNQGSAQTKLSIEVAAQKQHPSPFSNADMQSINLAAIEAAGGDLESRSAEIAKDIPDGGAGKLSPAAKVASQGAGWDVIRHVMQKSPNTGGYAVNDPQSAVSVPEGYNMGVIPAAVTTAAGLLTPGLAGAFLNIGTLRPGTPTLYSMFKNKFELEGTPLGKILGIPSAIRSSLTKPFTDLMGGAAREIGAEIGGLLPSLGEAPEGPTVIPQGPSEVRIPVQAALAPGETDEDEVVPGTEPEPFATDVSSEILALLDRTSEDGRRRLKELGLLA
jgi:hypothetical protein